MRIEDALEQIGLIRQFAGVGREAFATDLLVQSGILHRLVLLGEACRAISPELRIVNPDVPWSQIVGFRNVLVHEYFGVDLELVWRVLEELGGIEDALRRVLASL